MNTLFKIKIKTKTNFEGVLSSKRFKGLAKIAQKLLILVFKLIIKLEEPLVVIFAYFKLILY